MYALGASDVCTTSLCFVIDVHFLLQQNHSMFEVHHLHRTLGLLHHNCVSLLAETVVIVLFDCLCVSISQRQEGAFHRYQAKMKEDKCKKSSKITMTKPTKNILEVCVR